MGWLWGHSRRTLLAERSGTEECNRTGTQVPHSSPWQTQTPATTQQSISQVTVYPQLLTSAIFFIILSIQVANRILALEGGYYHAPGLTPDLQ